MYIWNFVRAYHFEFYQAYILENIDNPIIWKTQDLELKHYLLVACSTQKTNSHNAQNNYIRCNLSILSTKVYLK